jgi:hypothetical protein
MNNDNYMDTIDEINIKINTDKKKDKRNINKNYVHFFVQIFTILQCSDQRTKIEEQKV